MSRITKDFLVSLSRLYFVANYVLLCAVQEAQCNTEESPQLGKMCVFSNNELHSMCRREQAGIFSLLLRADNTLKNNLLVQYLEK